MFDEYFEKLKLLLLYVKKLRFSIVFVPDTSASGLSSKTFGFKTSLLLLLGYAVAVFFLSALFYNPVKSFLFPDENTITQNQIEEIDTLNKRLNLLLKEVEQLQSVNSKLKEVLFFSDSTYLDTTTIKKKNNSKKLSGNVYLVFTKIIGDFLGQNFPKFVEPMNGFISRIFNGAKGHYGIDYSAKIGTPVFAAGNGYVVFADFTTNDGFMMIINHPGDYVTIYKHCSVLLKNVRDYVAQSEIIALSGNSGKLTTGPHLHFEIWKDGSPIDPKPLLLKL